MPEIGDILQCLHDSRDRWRTIRMRGVEWNDHALSSEAFARELPSGPPAAAGQGIRRVAAFSGTVGATASSKAVIDDGSPTDGGSREGWAYWEAPGRHRAEYAVGSDTVTVVYDGATFWSWSPSSGARTNAGRAEESHGLGGGGTLLESIPLLSSLRFLGVERVEAVGRPALRAHAEPRPAAPLSLGLSLHALGAGAEMYVLDVDEERGVLLRSEARLHRQPFRVIEACEVAFDEELLDETFTIDLPEGETFDATRTHEMTTLQDLPSLVPFTVFAPRGDLGRPHVLVRRRRRGAKVVATVVISYHLSYGAEPRPLWIFESDDEEESAEGPGPETWRRLGDVMVSEVDEGDYVRRHVRLTRGTTDIRLSSTGASLEELLGIADSLSELPGAEPR